jgi:hypothetical protein
MPKLGQRTTEEMSDLCGQCHRTWLQIAADGPHDVNNVRFQPCAICHMPKYEIPGSHNLFSDHRIRVVKPGEPYPG